MDFFQVAFISLEFMPEAFLINQAFLPTEPDHLTALVNSHRPRLLFYFDIDYSIAILIISSVCLLMKTWFVLSQLSIGFS